VTSHPDHDSKLRDEPIHGPTAVRRFTQPTRSSPCSGRIVASYSHGLREAVVKRIATCWKKVFGGGRRWPSSSKIFSLSYAELIPRIRWTSAMSERIGQMRRLWCESQRKALCSLTRLLVFRAAERQFPCHAGVRAQVPVVSLVPLLRWHRRTIPRSLGTKCSFPLGCDAGRPRSHRSNNIIRSSRW